MDLFGRKAKAASEERATKLALADRRLALQEKVIKQATDFKDTMAAQMQSFKSMPDELYTTGIKQGPYAGLQSYNDNATSRRRSRIAHNESPVAQSFIGRIGTLTVGHGLELESQPMWSLIQSVSNWTIEQKAEWTKQTEARYKLWAKNKMISYSQDMNRYQQEQQEFQDLLIDGEYFELYRYSAMTKRNPMTIQLIRPEDVRTPSGSLVAQNNSEENGIEYDGRGVAVAYHIYNHSTQQTVRVQAKGTRSNRIFINHVKLGSNRRGVGIIANMVSELMKIGDYELLEIQAAIINAIYAVWFETPTGEDPIPVASSGIGSGGQASTYDSFDSEEATQWLNKTKELNYSEGGMVMDMLPGGVKPHSFDTKRPNVNFDGFLTAVKKNLSASRGIPISVLDQVFTTSYSASRGELILAWYEIDKYRFNQSMTNDLVFTMWMWGEIQRGTIQAEGFFSGGETMEAWANAKWIGNQRPDIDPLKSVNAHIKEHDRGYRTGKQITAERGGGDYDENLDRVGPELERVREVNGEAPDQPTTEGGATDTGETSAIDELKGILDSYGVGVRAGALTPVPEDEDHFRGLVGLPKMTKAARESWKDGGDTRHPITLQTGEAVEADAPPSQEDDPVEE